MSNKIEIGVEKNPEDLEQLSIKLYEAYRDMSREKRGALIKRIQNALGGQSYFSVYQKIIKQKWPNSQVVIAWQQVQDMNCNK